MNHSSMNKIWIVLYTLLHVVIGYSQSSNPLPWLSHIDPDNQLAKVSSIYAQADVLVSDSSTYVTTSLYNDPQRSIFQLRYPDQTITYGVEGKYYWQHDGITEKEVPVFFKTFVLGHQFHAHLLYLDQLYDSLTYTSQAQFESIPCRSVSGHSTNGAWTIFYHQETSAIQGMSLEIPEGPLIKMKVDDWRDIDGVFLPGKVEIDDGERIFDYHFTSLEFNEGELSSFRLSHTLLTDEQKLLALHRGVMDDHFFERYKDLKTSRADSLVIVNRGRVDVVSSHSFDKRFESILSTRKHSRYDDLIRPIVRISRDGTLAWVIVQVKVEGIIDGIDNETDDFDFISAWVELYEKKDDQWRMVGNVSNFAED